MKPITRLATIGLVMLLANIVMLAAEPVPTSGLPTEFIKECDSYLGDWASEVEIGGTVYRGTWIAKCSPDKTCLISHWAADTPNGPARGTRVEGWDALSKKILVVDFGSNGSSSIERYSITANQISVGEIAGIDQDGKPFKATARVLWNGPDFFTWIVTRDGQATEYRFRREKK